MISDRCRDIARFYSLLDKLIDKVGGLRRLSDCTGRMTWPRRGVYFFFEEGEKRAESGSGPRVVRIGTHAVKQGSKTTLWDRLRQHKGCARHGGGDHRGSVFRKLLGHALLRRDLELDCESWGVGGHAPREIRTLEHSMECRVSALIRSMPFVWLEADDEPGPDSIRKHIERNSIGLLSNWEHEEIIDAPSDSWLGKHCPDEKIKRSGLWNSDHVGDEYAPGFLGDLESLIGNM